MSEPSTTLHEKGSKVKSYSIKRNNLHLVTVEKSKKMNWAERQQQQQHLESLLFHLWNQDSTTIFSNKL